MASYQHAGNTSHHAVDDRAAEHGSQAEAGDVGLPLGGHPAEAADLNADRGEIGEAAQRIRHDRNAAIAEMNGRVRLPPSGKLLVRYELVGEHFFAKQLAGGEAILAFDADDPGDGSEQIA